MVNHQWYYRSESKLGTVDTVGPISEPQLKSLASAGTIRRETILVSQSRSAGKWIVAQAVPALLDLIERGEAAREFEKEQEAEKRKQMAAQNALMVQQREEEEHAQRRHEESELAKISHSQNFSLVRNLRDRVSTLLTSAERIAYIAVQEKPLINVSPDAVVATNRRLIFYRAKILGRYDFQDFAWLDLHNAHIQKKLLGCMFSCQHVSGQWMILDYLPKASAEALYRLAQEGEERAREARRHRELEFRRASAANVNTNINMPSYTDPQQFVEAKVVESEGPLQKLETLKTMLDRGLISPEDFDDGKKAILSQM